MITEAEEITEHKGNYKLILVILTELLSYLINQNNLLNISLVIKKHPMLYIRIYDENTDLYKLFSGNIEFKLVINLLRELIKTTEGSLTIDENSNREIVLLINTEDKN
jgi:hypothetical protein